LVNRGKQRKKYSLEEVVLEAMKGISLYKTEWPQKKERRKIGFSDIL